MPRLENRSIIVTGGASGIGRALCIAFAAEGARVVVGDVRRDPLHVGGTTTDQLIAAAGGTARFVEADVTQRRRHRPAGRAALELGDGRLDVIVNNAMVAGADSKGLLETSEDDWDIILDVGLRGASSAASAPCARCSRQEPRGEVRGRVINISSQHGMVGAPGQRRVLGHEGRRGQPDAPDRRRLRRAGHRLQRDRARQDRRAARGRPGSRAAPYAHARTPWPRLGEPEDVAALGVFLASDECRFMTGANVLIDGGFMAY